MLGFLRRSSRSAAPTAQAASAASAATVEQSFASVAPKGLPPTVSWPGSRRLDGLFQGNHETLLQGAGMRLSDIREYLPGDDVRHIDWNVSARTGSLHVRTFYEERELTAWFLIDTSASMGFGFAGTPKHQVARQVTDTLSSLLVRQADRFAALFHDGRTQAPFALLPPGTGQYHQVRLARLFMQVDRRPTATATAPSAKAGQSSPPTGTLLSPMLRRAFSVIRRRSLVIIVSDFLAAPGWDHWLRQLAHRHDVLCLRVVDPAECSIPDLGLITVEDAESGTQCLIDTGDPVIRARYAEIVASRERLLAATCRGAGADLLSIQTAVPVVPQLLSYLALRKKRRHLPAGNPAGRHRQP